jgi:hypothetical protein
MSGGRRGDRAGPRFPESRSTPPARRAAGRQRSAPAGAGRRPTAGPHRASDLRDPGAGAPAGPVRREAGGGVCRGRRMLHARPRVWLIDKEVIQCLVRFPESGCGLWKRTWVRRKRRTSDSDPDPALIAGSKRPSPLGLTEGPRSGPFFSSRSRIPLPPPRHGRSVMDVASVRPLTRRAPRKRMRSIRDPRPGIPPTAIRSPKDP